MVYLKIMVRLWLVMGRTLSLIGRAVLNDRDGVTPGRLESPLAHLTGQTPVRRERLEP